MPCSGQRLGSCAVLALLVLISNFGSSIARSDTIAYTNFGPDHSYNTLIGVTVDPSVSSGAQFISTATGTLSEIVAAIVWNAAQASTSFTLNIYDDNANTLGALLGSFSGTAGPSGSVAHLVLPSSGIDLTSGQAYWLVASSPNFLGWGISSPAPTGQVVNVNEISEQTSYSSSSFFPAFEVLVVVPEPSTGALVATAIVALGACVLRRRAKLCA